ncbi:hypothetical protein [uncultured Aliiroseovarius sp.]|uniref:hypothetical protein n=1 Tax=uncultured Aliiroseovarius sp. TaxID=1658783 RepID=UPI00338F00EA
MALTACAPEVPDSGAGVGFGDYDSYKAQRDAELSGTAGSLPPASAVSAGVLEDADTGAMPADATAPRPIGISDEQDFSAVAGRESIESDAARIAANRELYVQIEPTAVPTRSGGNGASIVTYALSTSNRVGESLYRRSGLGAEARFNRNCGKYTSADMAQADFLSRGGPQRDAKGLDPDGDGFACFWDPTPFRQARAAAAPAAAPAPTVSTLPETN